MKAYNTKVKKFKMDKNPDRVKGSKKLKCKNRKPREW